MNGDSTTKGCNCNSSMKGNEVRSDESRKLGRRQPKVGMIGLRLKTVLCAHDLTATM